MKTNATDTAEGWQKRWQNYGEFMTKKNQERDAQEKVTGHTPSLELRHERCAGKVAHTIKAGTATIYFNRGIGQTEDQSLALAKLIVRAVNSHEELVTLLQDVGAWFETHLRKGHINAGTANRNGDLVSQIAAAISKATTH